MVSLNGGMVVWEGGVALRRSKIGTMYICDISHVPDNRDDSSYLASGPVTRGIYSRRTTTQGNKPHKRTGLIRNYSHSLRLSAITTWSSRSPHTSYKYRINIISSFDVDPDLVLFTRCSIL